MDFHKLTASCLILMLLLACSGETKELPKESGWPVGRYPLYKVPSSKSKTTAIKESESSLPVYNEVVTPSPDQFENLLDGSSIKEDSLEELLSDPQVTAPLVKVLTKLIKKKQQRESSEVFLKKLPENEKFEKEVSRIRNFRSRGFNVERGFKEFHSKSYFRPNLERDERSGDQQKEYESPRSENDVNPEIFRRGNDINLEEFNRGNDANSQNFNRENDVKTRNFRHENDVNSHNFNRENDVKSHKFNQGNDVNSHNFNQGNDANSHNFNQGNDVNSHDFNRENDVHSHKFNQGNDVNSHNFNQGNNVNSHNFNRENNVNSYKFNQGNDVNSQNFNRENDVNSHNFNQGKDVNSHNFNLENDVNSHKFNQGNDVNSHNFNQGKDVNSHNFNLENDVSSHKFNQGNDVNSHNFNQGKDVNSHNFNLKNDVKSHKFNQGNDVNSHNFNQGKDVNSHNFNLENDVSSHKFNQGNDVNSHNFDRGNEDNSQGFNQGRDINSKNFNKGNNAKPQHFNRGSNDNTSGFNRGSDINLENVNKGNDIISLNFHRGNDGNSQDFNREDDVNPLHFSQENDINLENFRQENDINLRNFNRGQDVNSGNFRFEKEINLQEFNQGNHGKSRRRENDVNSPNFNAAKQNHFRRENENTRNFELENDINEQENNINPKNSRFANDIKQENFDQGSDVKSHDFNQENEFNFQKFKRIEDDTNRPNLERGTDIKLQQRNQRRNIQSQRFNQRRVNRQNFKQENDIKPGNFRRQTDIKSQSFNRGNDIKRYQNPKKTQREAQVDFRGERKGFPNTGNPDRNFQIESPNQVNPNKNGPNYPRLNQNTKPEKLIETQVDRVPDSLQNHKDYDELYGQKKKLKSSRTEFESGKNENFPETITILPYDDKEQDDTEGPGGSNRGIKIFIVGKRRQVNSLNGKRLLSILRNRKRGSVSKVKYINNERKSPKESQTSRDGTRNLKPQDGGRVREGKRNFVRAPNYVKKKLESVQSFDSTDWNPMVPSETLKTRKPDPETNRKRNPPKKKKYAQFLSSPEMRTDALREKYKAEALKNGPIILRSSISRLNVPKKRDNVPKIKRQDEKPDGQTRPGTEGLKRPEILGAARSKLNVPKKRDSVPKIKKQDEKPDGQTRSDTKGLEKPEILGAARSRLNAPKKQKNLPKSKTRDLENEFAFQPIAKKANRPKIGPRRNFKDQKSTEAASTIKVMSDVRLEGQIDVKSENVNSFFKKEVVENVKSTAPNENMKNGKGPIEDAMGMDGSQSVEKGQNKALNSIIKKKKMELKMKPVSEIVKKKQNSGEKQRNSLRLQHKTNRRWNKVKGKTYDFGFDASDKEFRQFRREERLPDGSVRGYYGYREPSGLYRVVSFRADQNGYHADEKILDKLPKDLGRT